MAVAIAISYAVSVPSSTVYVQLMLSPGVTESDDSVMVAEDPSRTDVVSFVHK